MRRNATTHALAWLTTCAGLTAPSRADDPPPLSPPAGSPAPADPAPTPAVPVPIPSPKPRAATTPSPIPPPRRDGRPVLALPGVTVPSRPTPPAPLPPPMLPPPSLAPSADGGLPPLEGPGGRAVAPGSTSTNLMPLPSSRFRSRVVESSPADEMLPSLDTPPLTPPNGRPSGARPPLDAPRHSSDPILLEEINARDSKPLPDPKDLGRDKIKDRDELPSPPARRPGLFGGRFNLMAPPSRGGMAGNLVDEARSDPAAEAAIKRRIERQARDAVGDRVKSIDVRVVGKSVTIQARGFKFLQRRPVRRSLESLPGLSGYRSQVELLD